MIIFKHDLSRMFLEENFYAKIFFQENMINLGLTLCLLVPILFYDETAADETHFAYAGISGNFFISTDAFFIGDMPVNGETTFNLNNERVRVAFHRSSKCSI